jgi:hypothetical protein
MEFKNQNQNELKFFTVQIKKKLSFELKYQASQQSIIKFQKFSDG